MEKDIYKNTVSAIIFPVCSKQKTTSGHNSMVLMTTSIDPGTDKSLVYIAIRNDFQDGTQSRYSVPFNRFMKKISHRQSVLGTKHSRSCFLGNIVCGIEYQTRGKKWAPSCTHSRGTACSKAPMCTSLQNPKQQTPNCHHRLRLARGWWTHCQPCHSNCRSHPLPLSENLVFFKKNSESHM